jgi:hypothetical protein
MIISVKFDFDPEDGDIMYFWNAGNIAAVKRCNSQRTELTSKKELEVLTILEEDGGRGCFRKTL